MNAKYTRDARAERTVVCGPSAAVEQWESKDTATIMPVAMPADGRNPTHAVISGAQTGPTKPYTGLMRLICTPTPAVVLPEAVDMIRRRGGRRV